MKEKRLKKQIINLSIAIVITSIVFCIAVIWVINYSIKAAHEENHIQMQLETTEYSSRISKQIEKNLITLESIAKSFEISGATQDKELLTKSIIEINKKIHFISFAYLPIDGSGMINMVGYGTDTNFTLDDCHEFSREAIKKSFKDENVVSKMFDSEIYYGKIFVYCVPVYSGNKVIGSLSASDTIDIFTEIANGQTVMGGDGYVHLLDAQGNYLVKSVNTVIQEDFSNVFDISYIDKENKQKTKQYLDNKKSGFAEFTYQNKKYHYYIQPLNINDWYLLCSSSIINSNDTSYHIMYMMAAVCIIILIINSFLLYYGFSKFKINTQMLINMAYFDQVTGCQNVTRFDDFIKERKNDKNYSIAAINIHNFKSINDLFGKDSGNKALKYIKNIIEQNLNEDEFFCRDSADLFYIYLTEINREVIEQRIMKIINTVMKSSIESEYSYQLTLYAGISILGNRETALIALQSIRNTHHILVTFYDLSLHDKIRKQHDVESHMQMALENKEFKLYLQPKNDLITNDVVGAEALVRWQLPNGKFRMPGDFIPLFEANGFCSKLDIYMVERVCELLRQWIDQGYKPIPISINQSKLLFSNLNYPKLLNKIVKKYNIPTNLITLEILEQLNVDDLTTINKQINALHENGFRVSMDDFGTGYSSLNMLYQLNIDELKLDKGFMRKASDNDSKRRQILLEQIIIFAKKLNIKTVAEGIETEDDRQDMIKINCDYGQGFLYERPISSDEFTEKYIKKSQ